MIKIKSKTELLKIIQERIEKEGPNCNLNDLDVSDINDLSNLFYSSKFNGYIDKWDVSNVKDMFVMFFYSCFNQDISKWDVSNVKNMKYMFHKNKSNLSKIKKSVCKWNFNPMVNLEEFMDNPEINNLEDIEKMCKREQILERIGSFRDLLDI